MAPLMLAAFQTVMQSASSTTSTTPHALAYTPEQHTDFVFAIVPDDFSIVALAVLVLLLFTLTFMLKRRRAPRKKAASDQKPV